MNKKLIIYIGNFAFPFGNASGKRVYGNGKLLRQVGYTTIFVGMEANLDSTLDLQATRKEFDGFEYYNFPYPRGTKDWINYKDILSKFIDWMQDKMNNTAAIICYGSPRLSLFISGLSRWAKRNEIKVVSDCVDWLEAKTGRIIFDISKTLDTYYQKAVANKRVDGVICISTYLEAYYKKAGKSTVVVPPLSNYVPVSVPMQEREIPQIVYAGSPFREKVKMENLPALKDRVDKMIYILKILKDNQVRFRFLYYGLDKDNYLTAFPMQKDVIKYLGDDVEFCGFQDNTIVTDMIKNSDFTFLVRDKKKSTMAGFPTKISESISFGTPVITTRTSDIDMYLEDGEQVLFIDENDLQKSAEIIRDVIQNGKYKQMKQKCVGNTIFYFETFEESVSKFLEKL